MILTGDEIKAEVEKGNIIINPFYVERIEPNSYGFRLGKKLLVYNDKVLDVKKPSLYSEIEIPESGYCLKPNKFYLGSTLETMGGKYHASKLFASRSVSCLGMWIHFSAPLGHTGALIRWTLEIAVTNPVIIYPEMTIGKISFWSTQGEPLDYSGKYTSSQDVIASKISTEYTSSRGEDM
jgi:dCTP deaminase